MITLRKNLSTGTQQLASQMAVVAQAAKSSLTTGLQICEKKSAEQLKQFEMCIDAPTIVEELEYPGETLYKEVINKATDYAFMTHYGKSFNEKKNNMASFFSPFMSYVARGNDSGSKNTISSSKVLVDEEVKIWGETSFIFDLHVVSHGLVSRRLVASARRVLKDAEPPSSQVTEPVLLKCRWKRRLVGQILEIQDAIGTEYIITADDVMSHIMVEAVEVNGNPNEIAYGECGPFELDPSFRKHIDDYLALGHTQFFVSLRSTSILDNSSTSLRNLGNVSPSVSWLNQSTNNGITEIQVHPQKENLEREQECDLILYLMEDSLRLVKPGRQNVGYVKEWSCSFGTVFPTVILSRSNLCEFELYLSASESLILAVLTCAQRDILALSIRCFHARQWVANSILLQHAAFAAGCRSSQMSHITYASLKAFPELYAVDMLSILYRLNTELYSCLERHEKCCRERDRAQIEKNSLEEDISFTLEAYQQLLNQTGTRPSTLELYNAQTLNSSRIESPEGKSECTAINIHTPVYPESKEANHIGEEYQHIGETFLKYEDCVSPHESFNKTQSKEWQSIKSYCRQMDREVKGLKQSNNALVEENNLLRVTIEKLEKQTSRSSSENFLPNVTLNSVATQTQVNELKHDNQRLKEAVTCLKGKLKTLKEEFDKALERMRDEAEILKQRAEKSEELFANTRYELDKVLTERNRHLKNNEVLSKDLEKLQALYESKTSALIASSQQMEAEKLSSMEALREALNEVSQSKLLARETSEKLQQELSQLREALKQKEAECCSLQKKNQLLHTRLRKIVEPISAKTPLDGDCIEKPSNQSENI